MRPRLSDSENVNLIVRVPVDIFNEFKLATETKGGMSVQTRKLITKWLRQVEAVQRRKK